MKSELQLIAEAFPQAAEILVVDPDVAPGATNVGSLPQVIHTVRETTPGEFSDLELERRCAVILRRVGALTHRVIKNRHGGLGYELKLAPDEDPSGCNTQWPGPG